MNWFKLAFRNLLRNRRRSLFTISAIALGYAAINLLGGFTDYVYKGLEDSYVYAYGNGHISVFKRGFLSEGSLNPTQYLHEKEDVERITTLVEADPKVVMATPQLNINGLVSNGQVSTIVIADGRIPADTNEIRNHARGFVGRLQMFSGRELDGGMPAAIGLTKGLAKKLGLALESDAIVMASTIDGYINALDAHVVQLLDAPMEILDDMMLSVPLSFARNLYGTEGADRVNILLVDGTDTASVNRQLSNLFAREGLEVELKSWDELRPSYKRIHEMFNVIFCFVFFVVLVIVALSIVNTISMSVMERTREIGTLRSLGLKRRGVMLMFAVEGALLGMAGSFCGFLLTVLGWFSVWCWQPTWIPPNIPKEVPLEIHMVTWCLTTSLLCLILLSSIAAILPARRASLARIVDALGHN